jgi:hypothetical protein
MCLVRELAERRKQVAVLSRQHGREAEAQQAMPSCGVPGSSRTVYYAPDLDHLDRSQRYWSEGQDRKPAQGGDDDALYEENPLGAVDGGQGAKDDCWQQ